MKITDYAIKNYQFTLIITLMVAALGISSLLTMPRAEDPEINAPSFPVTVIYPGTPPKDMEEFVVKPLEQKIYGLNNIKKIKTTITDGVALLLVEYEYSSNVDDKFQELNRTVNSMRSQLPSGIYSIEVKKVDPTDVNILQMELVSENASRDKLRTTARDLKEALEKVHGLKNVEIQGLPEPIVRIDLNLSKMAHLKVPLDAVAKALKSELTNIPGGAVVEGDKTFNVKANSDFRSIQEIKNVIIAGAKEGSLRLKDIANVYFDYTPPKHIVRLNGHRAVSVIAALKKDQNITDVQKAYLPVINHFKELLPANIDLVLHFDQADNVNHRLGGLGEDFLIAICLVLLTLLPLGNRASLVVMIAIPLSLAIGVILLNLLDYSLNQLSIVGFVVALGLLVDDSIVVVENIERWMREGYGRMEAVKRATGQITTAVLGCTATLIIAFMPLLFLPEKSGDFIRSLPVSIIATIFGSMIVALTVVPFFSSKILKPHKNPEGNRFLRALKKAIHKTYAPILDKGLKHPGITLMIAAAAFGGSLLLIQVIGMSLFPSSEKPQFLIDVSTPLQSNIYYTDSVMRTIEQQLAAMPEVEYYTANTGKGNPQIYYNVLQRNESSDFGEIFVQLRPDIKANEKKEIIAQLRNRWTPFKGAKVEVKDFQQGLPMAAPVEVKVFGDNLDTLRSLAARVEDSLRNTEGTIYVNNPIRHLRSDIQVHINKEKAQSLGVPTAMVGQAVRMAISGLSIGTFTEPGNNNDGYGILLTVPHPPYPNLSLFNRLYVSSYDGKPVRLNKIARLELESSPTKINRLNKVRTASVTSFVRKGYLNDDVIQKVIHKMDKVDFPKGYHYEMGGEFEGRSESFSGLGSIILVASFLFIAVLILQFGTLKSTLIVLSVIPLGIVGAVLALLVTGNSLSFVATIGIIALAGIEVKNTILQVDFTNELRAQGMPLIEAIEKAGEARFLPIILTTLTAIGGLTPIALSSNPLISPLAIVMIGGLISSTLLSRVVTPVVYKLIPPKVEVAEKDM